VDEHDPIKKMICVGLKGSKVVPEIRKKYA
jgi:hypothetical protein